MGAANCITAVMSDVQQYNMHNTHIKTQQNKHICSTIHKDIIKKRESKANKRGKHNTGKVVPVYSVIGD